MAAFVTAAVGLLQVMEREKWWGVLFEVIIHCTALAHQTAPTDGYFRFLFALAFFVCCCIKPFQLRNYIKGCLRFNQRLP